MADTNNRLSISDAQARIREIAKNGFITPSYHCRNDHPERNYSLVDVEYILRNGVVTKEPEYDPRHQNWKYRVEGKTIDDDEAVAITVIISHRELNVITVYPK